MPDRPGQAPEGRPDPGDEQPVGRDRLVRAMRRPSRSQAVVGVLLATVGFAAVTQIRETEDSAYTNLREQDLIDVLDGLAGTTQRTQAEIDRLTREREDLRDETTRREAALERTRREVDALNVLAGRVPVSGPGVRITIEEVTDTIAVSSFLDVIQELRSVGAEAIQVNGQVRLVAQSSFEAGTGGIVVDGQLVEPPYVVDAIGDATTLAGAMVFALGPRRAIAKDGGELTVEELGSLDIDTVRRATEPGFARPDS
jgi:uncharacterized protein YlxW (UPF0749 family)